MKKLLPILLFFVVLLSFDLFQAPTVYYISPYPVGQDGPTRSGSASEPWLHLGYAATRVTTAGDKIFVNTGTYTEPGIINLAIGVSIQGAGESVTRIESSLATAGQPLFLLQTLTPVPGWLGTYGNQSISRLTFDGNNTTYSAIQVNYRSNVTIEHCTILDFTRDGVIFYGMPLASWGGTSIFEPDRSMPNYWCTGNKLLNCVITNNSGPSDGANVRIGQQNGIEIAYNTIYQPIRGSGTNCGGVKFYDEGWSKNTDFHHNSVKVDLNPGNRFNFSLEMWYELGGCHYYNNVFQGGADFDGGDKGSSTYSVWFHHNEVGYPTYQIYNHHSLNFEASFSDVIIEKNHIHHVQNGLYFSQIWPNSGWTGRDNHPYNTVLNNIRISCNLFVNLGKANGPSDWEPVFGIMFGRDNQTLGLNDLDNISVLNNVFTCGSVTPDSYYVVGIWLPNSNLTVDNLIIRNNIITGFIGGSRYSAPIFGTGLYGTEMAINSYYVDNNDFYGNGNSNAILRVSGYPAPTTSDNNITTNPLFVGTGGIPYSYKLQTGSGAIRTGINVGLLTDYLGLDWLIPPDRGALVYTTGGSVPTVTTNTITAITSTTATGGGNVTADGGAAVTARGVCWSTSQNPTTADSKTTNGTGTGSYISYLISLTEGYTYYVRAYATNTNGTAYGNQRSFVATGTPAADVLVKSGYQFIKSGNVLIRIE